MATPATIGAAIRTASGVIVALCVTLPVEAADALPGEPIAAPSVSTPAVSTPAVSTPAVSVAIGDRSGERHCPDTLDAAVATARRGDLASAHDSLVLLARECTAWPQIEHALGVIAMRRGDDDGAIRHLERAIALDERTARTVDALREVHRWRASTAWREALGEPRGRGAPRLGFVDSATGTAARRADAAHDALVMHERVVAYELYEWWRTLRFGDAEDVATHYDADASPPPFDAAALPSWEEVRRDIELTRDEAVAVVRWEGAGSAPDGRLLLLRTEGDRWLIYRESVL